MRIRNFRGSATILHLKLLHLSVDIRCALSIGHAVCIYCIGIPGTLHHMLEMRVIMYRYYMDIWMFVCLGCMCTYNISSQVSLTHLCIYTYTYLYMYMYIYIVFLLISGNLRQCFAGFLLPRLDCDNFSYDLL